MGAAQASLRRPKGIDDTRQAPRCRVRAGSFPRCPFGGRFRWPLRQDQSCYACFQGTASRETRVRNLGPRLGGGAVTSACRTSLSSIVPLCRLELTLSLQGGGEKHASFKAGGPATPPRSREPAPTGTVPGGARTAPRPAAQRAAARNSSINRSKLPGKIFSSQTEAPPPSASANKYRPRGGGGGSAAASREAPRGSQVPGKGRLFVRPAGARPPSAHGPAPCAPPRPPPRSPPPASEASPRRRPSRPSARLLRAALRAPAPSRAPPRPPRASFAAPRAGRRTERGEGRLGPGPTGARGPRLLLPGQSPARPRGRASFRVLDTTHPPGVESRALLLPSFRIRPDPMGPEAVAAPAFPAAPSPAAPPPSRRGQFRRARPPRLQASEGPLLTAPSESSLSAFRFPAAPSVAPATRGSSQQGLPWTAGLSSVASAWAWTQRLGAESPRGRLDHTLLVGWDLSCTCGHAPAREPATGLLGFLPAWGLGPTSKRPSLENKNAHGNFRKSLKPGDTWSTTVRIRWSFF
ncbi:translation initiation factor IF-2-like [Acinonyx jubatus]|uniref:Translation initiation factor IF-2-like n=1 Tax=Acinonyx jubatus TaxID=32536 RepID=A0A6J1YAY8_ACIJB|nr:translation initiation factor IF-2-like [Acinonyx jubatus]